MTEAKYDYIIVGAGSAGCIVANRLSADEKVNVLLVEAGGENKNFWLHLPVGYFRTIYDDRFSAKFSTEPSEGTGGRSIVWPRGRVLGGSSSINGLIFIRGQKEDYDDWEAQGAKGWSYKNVLPYFKKLESYSGKNSDCHGKTGELKVSDLRNDHPYCEAWLGAAQEYGLPFNSDLNDKDTLGVGRYQLTLNGRWRSSSATAFLKPAKDRKNLTVLKHAKVTRVIFDGNKAVGVEWKRNGNLETKYVSKEVVLCTGAIQSPQILQLSGIGPTELLNKHGIKVVSDSPQVGENLQDHYQMRVILRLKKKRSLNDDVRNPFKLAKMGFDWLFKASGPLTVGAGQVGGSCCTKYSKNGRPDIQFNVMPLSVDKPGEPLHDYSGFTVSVFQCHPASRGTVHIDSNDPLASPRIVPNYFKEEIDRNVMIEGVKIAREINDMSAFRDLWDIEVEPGKNLESDAEIWDAIRNKGGTVFHCVGTCRMGEDEEAVVDSTLKVKGVEGLRVIDASVMPKITSANTNAASLMIGEKGVACVLDDLYDANSVHK